MGQHGGEQAPPAKSDSYHKSCEARKFRVPAKPMQLKPELRPPSDAVVGYPKDPPPAASEGPADPPVTIVSAFSNHAIFNNLLTPEHGTETDKVPFEWRGDPRLSLFSVYGLSSFCYTLTGIWLAWLLAHRPERKFWPLMHVEAGLWIWQGLISYMGDVVDLGIPSWSHPADRISVLLFGGCGCYYIFLNCRGDYGRLLLTCLRGVGMAAFYAFGRGSQACREAKLDAYRCWHTLWHTIFPFGMAAFYGSAFLLPEDACVCSVKPYPDVVTFAFPLAGLILYNCYGCPSLVADACRRAYRQLRAVRFRKTESRVLS